jgi:hypothetical protein
MLPRKLKLDKKFSPYPIDDDDEIYRNGIFEFNITKLIAFIASNAEDFPVEQLDVSSLVDVPNIYLNEETILEANLSNSIILAEFDPGRFNVIDGNHRVEKANRANLEKILAYRVTVAHHFAFLTSVKAYEIYVKYWNSKIEGR